MKCLIVLLALTSTAFAQATKTAVDKVFLQTGTTFSGKVLGCNDDALQLKLSTGLTSELKLARIKSVRLGAPDPAMQRQIAISALKAMNPSLAFDTSENTGQEDLRFILGYPGLKDGLDTLAKLLKDEVQAKRQKDTLARNLAEVKKLPEREEAIKRQIEMLDANPPPSEIQGWQSCAFCHRTGRVKVNVGGVNTYDACPECRGAGRFSLMMENSKGIAQWNLQKTQAANALAQVRNSISMYLTGGEGHYTVKPEIEAEAAKGEADYQAAQDARAKCEQDLQTLCAEILKRAPESPKAADGGKG